ncbi:transcriptional regulator [Vibrio sp. SM6]|uniref:Transcriptional regulator n=1 Tax=Vibrio agarilyticus TaxID=2726741 RepID=A0A7X8TQ26_9VIBR|nr:SoxR reducing system RseC family protein [Vibrio agarilyticus]NLS12845.1 transcriptional regulator [Vibrio agarilyticus]
MMTALATVTLVRPSHDGQLGFDVEVSCQQQTSCQSCASNHSCGTGIVTKAIGNKTHQWRLHTKNPLKVGQIVEIGLPEGPLLQSALLVYLLPLLGLLIGALLGQWGLVKALNFGELPVIVCGALGGYFGYRCAKFFSHRFAERSQQFVSLLRVLGEPIA